MPRNHPAQNKFQVPDVIRPAQTLCLTMQVPDDKTHIANVLGAIAGLTMARAYHDKPGVKAVDIARVWRDMMLTIKIDGCATNATSTGCVDYDLLASFVHITPVSPYDFPHFVPTGYLFPPWHIVQPAPDDAPYRLLGYITNDILVLLSSLPPSILTGFVPPVGFPHARFEMTGRGEINVTVLAVPQGGDAIVAIDGDNSPAGIRTIPLALDFSSLPIQNDVTVTISHEFKQPGRHTLDITFVPKFITAPPFVLFGGGLRSVQLCGFETALGSVGADEGIQLMIRQNPDKPCLLESSLDGVTWCEFADISKCLPSQSVIDTTTGGTPAPGRTGQNCITLETSKGALLPLTVKTGDSITLDSCKGFAWDGVESAPLGLWRYGNNGDQSFGGLDGNNPIIGVTGDPVLTAPHMTIIAAIGTGPAYIALPVGVPIAVPSVPDNSQVFIQVNTSNIALCHGAEDICVTVRNNSLPLWTRTFDFTTNPNGWVEEVFDGSFSAQWIGAVGWQAIVPHSVGIKHTVPTGTIFLPGAAIDSESGDSSIQLFIWDHAAGPITNLLTLASPYTTAAGESVYASKENLGTLPTIKSVTLNGSGVDPF